MDLKRPTHECHVEVRLFSLPGTLAIGTVVRISLVGALIETNAAVTLGARVHIESLRSGMEGRKRRVAAEVVRRVRTGIEVRWCEPAAGHRSYAYLNVVPTSPAPAHAQPAPLIDGVYYYRFEFLD